MTRKTLVRGLVAAALILIGLVGESVAVVVAPTAVYMTPGDPSAGITLYNPTEESEEVTVETAFGYPATDSAGDVYMHLDDGGADARSAASWVRAYPRRLLVPPGERRVVRLLARPPADLDDGEYWTRVVVTSRGQSVPTTGVPDSGDVRVGIDLEVRTVIAAAYRKGPVRTGVRIEDLAPRLEGDTLRFRPRLVRTGEGAYIGRMEAELLDADGSVVETWSEQVAVYREYHRRYRYPVADPGEGPYRLRLRLGTDREDIPAEHRLSTDPVVRTAEVLRR